MRVRSLCVVAVLVFLAISCATTFAAPQASSGSLMTISKGKVVGECPLKHTDVRAGLSGSFARVTVTQAFENTATDTIEAVYTFPLPHDAAVDDMTIRIGTRTIRGLIKRREDAQKIYEKAIRQGQTAALLDQERPNIFTQRVGNIPAGGAVEVTISYVQQLKYEEGAYEFAFPMVVGPRYIPGRKAISKVGGGFSPDTNRVPDASKITPPVSATRAGHDISIAVAIDAGVPIQNLRSTTHQIDARRPSSNQAAVLLRDEATIPNKDFVLRYDVAGNEIAEGLLTHTRSAGDGYFSLIVQPPARFKEADVTPKEIVFVLDSSGSMSGFPEQQAKRLIATALGELYAGDTFNLIKFSGETAVLFDEPVYPTAENLAKAHEFLSSRWGGGGTEMMKAIKAALDPSDAQDHLRIVVFLTDGYVGNDFEILSEIRKHPNARVFAFGIGSSVNRYLITGMGQHGNGDSEIVTDVTNKEEADAAAKRLYEHLRSPLLTDITLDFGSLPVTDVYPTRINDLFAGRPVVVTGRYTRGAKGTVTLRAKRSGDAYTQEVPVVFPASTSENSVLPNLWARAKIEHLMSQDLAGMQQQEMKPELQKQITQIGLSYRLMTQFTSFVAVDERVVTEGGKPRTVQVPVELPEGVQWEGVWADKDEMIPRSVNQAVSVNAGLSSGFVFAKSAPQRVASAVTVPAPPPPPPGSGYRVGGGVVSGIGAGVGGGVGPGEVKPWIGGSTKPDSYATKEERVMASKMSPKLLEDYRCWQKLKDKHTGNGGCRVGGAVRVEVVLSNAADVSALKAAGFEMEGKVVKGRVKGKIAIEKLQALAGLKQVRFITPTS